MAAVLAQAASGNSDVLLRAQQVMLPQTLWVMSPHPPRLLTVVSPPHPLQAVGVLHSQEFLRGEAGRYWVALCAAPRDLNPSTAVGHAQP